MTSIFSGLPNNIIIKIIQIENRRSQTEELRKKYEEVVKHLNRITTYLPHIRETINKGGRLRFFAMMWLGRHSTHNPR